VGESYFVRARDDAPEKGPYTPAQLVKSQEKGLLGAKATARASGSEEWLPLKDVVAALLAARSEKKRARESADLDANDAHALGSVPRPRRFNFMVWFGVIIGLAGVATTAAMASSGSPGATWPLALTLGGAYIAVRGLISGTRRDEHE